MPVSTKPMLNTDENRRHFLGVFSGLGLGGTLLPGVLWSQVQQTDAQSLTPAMLDAALALSGLSFPEEDRKSLLQAANQNLARYAELRAIHIPNDISPPFYFSPIVPGMKVNRRREPRYFSVPRVRRPANLEDAAFWPVIRLAQLIRTRQVTSVELTEMYLARLHRYNPLLNCVVTFLDDLALAQAKQADTEIAAGEYKGLLHGIPWGAKDIIAVKGYPTTWGSGAFRDQMLDDDASVIEMVRAAGGVLLAKLASGELAGGDRWFGGQTRNPWNTAEGSGGSSAGPASATAAGLVGFGIGSETNGSILNPSGRCGATGLRPTFGRVSRHGVMTLSWTQDRLGPICRYAEDCALVMSVIAKPDDRDMSVSDIPFNWTPAADIRKLRVGYLADAFEETKDPVVRSQDEAALDKIRSLGVKLTPVRIPADLSEGPTLGVESSVFFDEFVRSGRDRQMTNPSRGAGLRNGRLISAVDYLQSQRLRTMMMMKLAEATATVDIYLVPAFIIGSGRPAESDTNPAAAESARRSVSGLHYNMANSAGYPAVTVPHGFIEAGNPTALVIYGRPFAETQVLALAKAYQDVSGIHLKHPNLDGPLAAAAQK
jgi:Asp-tRNA(Asn)/Glu-tRNA(Gln) amidotransferase A subunit family amidase